jgi:hypothetical protein
MTWMMMALAAGGAPLLLLFVWIAAQLWTYGTLLAKYRFERDYPRNLLERK